MSDTANLALCNTEILHLELHRLPAVEFVDHRLGGEVEAGTGLQLVGGVAAVEGDAADEQDVLFDGELEVVAGFADAARGAGQLDGLAAEQGLGVGGAEGAQALEVGDEG